MSCREYNEAIAELLDGALDSARQRDLERHVEGCPACRALVADLKSIQASAFTLDRLELPAHILPALQAQLAEAPRPGSGKRLLHFPTSRPAMIVWMAAAAALLVMTTVGILSLMRPVEPHQDGQSAETAPVDPAQAVEAVQAELQAATEHYERAIQQLEQIAKSDNGALDPQVAAVFQKNLSVLDQAIDESRAALQVDSLFEAMRSKAALLQQTVEVINEMRKGNQAEAGRLLQGLNQ
jgi:anti-sigma factor RsiW